jgi:hypothetical protein
MNCKRFHAGVLGSRSLLSRAAVVAFLVLGVGGIAESQVSAVMQPMATRADLTALAERLERGSGEERTQAAVVRGRLREGDFRPGDRISLVI